LNKVYAGSKKGVEPREETECREGQFARKGEGKVPGPTQEVKGQGFISDGKEKRCVGNHEKCKG